jgi:3-oxoacyl-[acyl-carrier protein] reductase
MTITAYVALGSNLGDRRMHLDHAVTALRAHPGIERIRRSTIYETAPVGGPSGQGPYLNAVAELETTLAPDELLRLLLSVEAENGRERTVVDGPRTLDLDLLLYDSAVRTDSELILPHPRLHLRAFVLVPLAELAPGLVHPVLRKTIGEMLADLQGIRPVEGLAGRELTGLRALVTGSTSGIGEAIALALAEGGADVIVHGRRSAAAAEAVAARVRTRGGRSTVLLADLRDATARHQLIDAAWSCWQGLDVLVNNAGADTLTGDAASWSFERKLDELFAVDVAATMTLARALGQRMHAAGSGTILNMGWDQAETGMEGDSGELFAATKGAIMAFTRSLALGLAPRVRVNCLAPGWIRTAWGENASSLWHQRVLRETPLQRWGTPADAAALARWAVSPAASFVTGQMLRVNGGAIR